MNPSPFKNHEQFLSEYLLISDDRELRTLFGIELSRRSCSLGPYLDPVGDPPLYHCMEWLGPLSRVTDNERMSRTAIRTWLVTHLLKICIPYPRTASEKNALVLAPLNLTAFFRLVVHISELGYPAHWLSAVLETVFRADPMTTARAPRQEIIDREALEQRHPAIITTLYPWQAELTTLGAIWKHLLPFGLLMTGNLLPKLGTVRKYQIAFSASQDMRTITQPHTMLVFWSEENGQPPVDIRRTLLHDEMGEISKQANEIRRSGLHVLTTFKWDTETKTASFWLREDVVQSMIQGNWKAYVWGTDTYTRITDGVPVDDYMNVGLPWIEKSPSA